MFRTPSQLHTSGRITTAQAEGLELKKEVVTIFKQTHIMERRTGFFGINGKVNSSSYTN